MAEKLWKNITSKLGLVGADRNKDKCDKAIAYESLVVNSRNRGLKNGLRI